MYPGKYLLISLVLTLESVLVMAKSLTMQLNGYDDDCVYLSKEKDEKLDYMLISGGAKLDFTMFEPNENSPNVQRHEVTEHEQIGLLLNKTGDYKFCFANAYQSHPINVLFEYDMFEDIAAAPNGNMQKEKDIFVKKAKDAVREMFDQQGYHLTDDAHKRSFMKAVVEHQKEALYHGEGKGADDRLKGTITMIGIYMDEMEKSLSRHGKRIGRHHFLQMINHDRVMQYSILISLAMVVSTCVQLVVVKGFFNGKMSLNVFSYK